jgi:hypothetical protein
MNVKEEFFSRGSFKVGDGLSTRFWEDTWLCDKPLAQHYSSLYNIVNKVIVASVLGQPPLNINFRHALSESRWRIWLQLVQRLMLVNLSIEKDIFV